MKKMKELQEQTSEEIRALFHELSREIFGHKNEISTNRKIDKPHLLSSKRRTRARILTILRQRGETL